MKKIKLIPLGLIGILALTSCNSKNKFSLDATGVNISLADTWLKDVSYNEESINEYVDTNAHYRIYLPTDIESNIKVNVVSLEDTITDRFKEINVPYATGTSFADPSGMLSIYSVYFEQTPLELSFTTEVPKKWNSPLTLPEELKDKEDGITRSLYTVYLPSYVERYGMYDKELKLDCKSYVLIPIAFSYMTSTDEDNLLTSAVELAEGIKSLDTVSFETKNGLLI